MNRDLITRKLAEKMNLSLVDSRNCMETLLEIISEGLIDDGEVTIYGFGRIFVLPQSPRLARNPKTGKEVMIKPRNTIRLKPSRYLINRINKIED